MPDAVPASEFESFTHQCIYKALPFRKAQWVRWLERHRANYKAMEQEIAGRLQLDETQRDLLGEIVRKWM